MSSIIKVGKVQSSTGQDAVTVADSGAITASGGIANAGTITAGTLGSSVVVPASVGSSLVLLESYTANNNSSKDFDLSAYTTYNEYRFSLVQLGPISNGGDLQVFLGTNSSTFHSSANNYRVGIRRWYYGGSGTTFTSVDNSVNTMIMHASSVSYELGRGVFGFFSLYKPRDSGSRTGVTIHTGSYTSNDNAYIYTGAGFRMNDEDNTHIRFEFHNGNLKDGQINLYGVKNA